MNRFHSLLAALALLMTLALPARGQRIDWITSQQNDTTTYHQPPVSVTDSVGNTYQVSIFRGTMTTPVGTLISFGGSQDLYLIKYNAAGQAQWVRQIASAYYELALAIALDPAGDVCVAGYADSGTRFDSITTLAASGLFLAKYRPDGSLRRVQPIHITARTPSPYPLLIIRNLKIDPAGNCYFLLGGVGEDSIISVQNIPTNTVQYIRRAVLKTDSVGNGQWLAHITGVGGDFDFSFPFAVDAEGNSFVSGFADDSLFLTTMSGTTFIGDADPSQVSVGSRGYVAKLSSTGALLWSHRSPSRYVDTVFRNTSYYFTALAVDKQGDAYLGYAASDTFQLGGVYSDQPPGRGACGIIRFAPDGRARWIRAFTGYDTILYQNPPEYIAVSGQGDIVFANGCLGSVDTTGAYQGSVRLGAVVQSLNMDRANNVYVSAWLSSMPGSRDSTTFGIATFRRGYDYVIRGRFTPNHVTGTVYVDQNANNQRDAGEPAYPRPLVIRDVVRTSYHSNYQSGRYVVARDSGNYQISLPVVPRYYQLRQGSSGYQGHFASYGEADTARHFGLAPIANQPDVRVTLTPYSAARRGFANRYRARVENVGTTVASGALTVTFDSATTYTGATPPPAQQSGTSATWNFAGLAPFATQSFDVAATVPLNVALGTVIHPRATVAVPNDLDASNDVDSVTQTVVGSWDPNDLTVNYTSLTPAQVAAGTVLDYVVRFQNMGTDTAFTVVIQDTLAAQLLQLGTLQLVSQSHNCWWNILGNNKLVVRFDNINLPARTTSAPNSMGFVRFQVTPSAALTPGALIPNTAHIFFDYNAPVATNLVTTLVQTPNGLVAEPGAATWSLFPNPATTIEPVLLTAEVATAGSATVRLQDALGRSVREARFAASAGALRCSLDVRGLAPGVYGVQLFLPDGTATARRLVVGGR